MSYNNIFKLEIILSGILLQVLQVKFEGDVGEWDLTIASSKTVFVNMCCHFLGKKHLYTYPFTLSALWVWISLFLFCLFFQVQIKLQCVWYIHTICLDIYCVTDTSVMCQWQQTWTKPIALFRMNAVVRTCSLTKAQIYFLASICESLHQPTTGYNIPATGILSGS